MVEFSDVLPLEPNEAVNRLEGLLDVDERTEAEGLLDVDGRTDAEGLLDEDEGTDAEGFGGVGFSGAITLVDRDWVLTVDSDIPFDRNVRAISVSPNVYAAFDGDSQV